MSSALLTRMSTKRWKYRECSCGWIQSVSHLEKNIAGRFSVIVSKRKTQLQHNLHMKVQSILSRSIQVCATTIVSVDGQKSESVRRVSRLRKCNGNLPLVPTGKRTSVEKLGLPLNSSLPLERAVLLFCALCVPLSGFVAKGESLRSLCRSGQSMV